MSYVKYFYVLWYLQLDDVHETAPHSHSSDVNAVEVAKSAVRMRTAIQSAASARPAQVLAAELVTMSQDVRAAMPTKEHVARRLGRQQRGVQPRIPATLAEIDLPDKYRSTGVAGKEFLIGDSGRDDPRRMLVFASYEQPRQLSVSDT